MVLPSTSNFGFFSMPGIWSGGTSQMKSNWPASRPLMRVATSGTTMMRTLFSGGRPPQ